MCKGMEQTICQKFAAVILHDNQHSPTTTNARMIQLADLIRWLLLRRFVRTGFVRIALGIRLPSHKATSLCGSLIRYPCQVCEGAF